MTEKFLENCLAWKDPMLEQGKSVSSFTPDKEEEAERMYDKYVTKPIPYHPVHLGPVEKGSDSVALVGTWHPVTVKPPQNLSLQPVEF
ncbi:hypothetical protein WISP_63121 [Willisornis vidua]|uniref:Uncharacterized protein n=1 Tax=Willisornis vidua TaxID=1566151 RepID=A0ABQ9D9X4_9PASS|nr:hypothetical protein WISP_63121 [Willisornis vidua]